MSRAWVRPFEAADAPAAGRLLAARHVAHRACQPLLSGWDAAASTRAVEEVLDGGGTGAVAVEEGELTGYLLGAPKADVPWGPNIWVESSGHAVTEPETVRDLYALAAAPWAATGRTAHYVVVPTHDRELVDAWFRLGFGAQQEHAIRDLSPVTVPRPSPVTTRPAVRADVPVLGELDVEVPRAHHASPVFSSMAPPAVDDSVAEWAEFFDDEGFHHVVAEVDGRVVGFATGCALSVSSMHTGPARPDGAGYLGFAVVHPDARGLGVGRVLTAQVVDRLRADGFPSVVCDWRATNLFSSRAWPALGFQPTFVRVHRLLGY
jgi:ribosomal protein S18 acetylase RimI-like enzyme